MKIQKVAFLMFSIGFIIAGIVWGNIAYSHGDLFAVLSAPSIVLLGLIFLVVWFSENFKTK